MHSKTISSGEELNAHLDRLVTEKRQLMRRIKALEDASCEKETESKAFYTLLNAKFNKASDEDEASIAEKIFTGKTVSEKEESEASDKISIIQEFKEPPEDND